MLLQAAAVCPACVDLGSEHSHESAMCRICSTSPAFNGAHVRLYGCRFPAACYMFTAGPPLRQWRHMVQRPTTPGSTLFDAGWWLAGGVLSACAECQVIIIPLYVLFGRCCGGISQGSHSLPMLLQAAAVCPACVDLGRKHSHESAIYRRCFPSITLNEAQQSLHGCRFPAPCYMFTAGPPLRQWWHILQWPRAPGPT